MKNISTKKSVVLIAAVIVLILAGIIISVSTDKNRKKQEADSKASVSVTRTDLKNEASSQQQNIKEQTDVEILFENKAVPVGTSLKVTAIVTPDDDDKSIVWTSSNTDVFTVDKDGVITVIGSGTATLTATVGSVSDAIVIEGIRNVAAGSDNGFSVYTHTAGSISSGSNTGSGSASEGDSRLENRLQEKINQRVLKEPETVGMVYNLVGCSLEVYSLAVVQQKTHLQKIIMILEVLAQEKLKIRLLIMDLNRQFLMFMYVSRMGHIMVRL